MPCIDPPPPQISAYIEVIPGSPHYTARITPKDAQSAPYISPTADGHLDFSCFKHKVTVQFEIKSPNYKFYVGLGADTMSFVDDPTALPPNATSKPPLSLPHHQFKKFSVNFDRTILRFDYQNNRHCGHPHGHQTCDHSLYGFYFANSDGSYAGATDPIVDNGGIPPDGAPPPPPPPLPPKAR